MRRAALYHPLDDPLLARTLLACVLLPLIYLAAGGRADLLTYFGVPGMPNLNYLPIIACFSATTLLIPLLRRRRFALARTVAAVLTLVLACTLGGNLLGVYSWGSDRFVVSVARLSGVGIMAASTMLTLAVHLLHRRHTEEPIAQEG